MLYNILTRSFPLHHLLVVCAKLLESSPSYWYKCQCLHQAKQHNLDHETNSLIRKPNEKVICLAKKLFIIFLVSTCPKVVEMVVDF